MPRLKNPRSKRADSPEQKGARRQLILQAASAELAALPSAEDFTLETLAGRTGLAKGTIYLYFDNKTSILQALLVEAASNLMHEIAVKLSGLSDPVTAAQVARVVRELLMKSVKTRGLPHLLRSFAQDEKPTPAHQEFAEKAYPTMDKVDAIMVRRLPGLQRGEGRRIMLLSLALLLGLTEMAEHRMPKITKYPGEREEPSPKNVGDTIEKALTMLIQGYLSHPREPRSPKNR
jgi:AcrR family transcriptional regulator